MARNPRPDLSPTTPDPIEIAMEAEAGDMRADSPARRLLIKHGRLLDRQLVSENLSIGLKLLTGLAGLAAASALGVMVWQAAHADGVVLEPFTVPPALAADGVSGEVVANQVLDELARLRAETVTPGRLRDYGNNWGHSIKVAIPGSGISLGDLQTALREWLGHETHITGEVYRTAKGIAVSARVPGQPGLLSEGPADQLPALAQNLARQVYRGTQPLRYARWLIGHGGPAEAEAIAQPIALTGSTATERAEAFNVWLLVHNKGGDPAGAVALARRGLALAPGNSSLWRNLAINEANLGHSEAATAANRELIKRLPRDREVPPAWRRGESEVAKVDIAVSQYDFTEALRHLAAEARVPAIVRDEAVQIDRITAASLGRLHDINAARARLAAPETALPWQTERNQAQLLSAAIAVAGHAQDWPEAARLGDPYLALPAIYFDPRHSVPRSTVGVARARMGDRAGAHALLDDLAEDCDACMVQRAIGLSAMGEPAEAERLLAMVQTQAPSSPFAPYWRGRLRSEAGDAAGALPFFREAQRRSPHWADSFEAEGEALATLGRWSEAVAAYAKAEPLAPKWGRLHLKWGEALSRQGKTAEAREHWRKADGLFLTSAERADLSRLQGAT